ATNPGGRSRPARPGTGARSAGAPIRARPGTAAHLPPETGASPPDSRIAAGSAEAAGRAEGLPRLGADTPAAAGARIAGREAGARPDRAIPPPPLPQRLVPPAV